MICMKYQTVVLGKKWKTIDLQSAIILKFLIQYAMW